MTTIFTNLLTKTQDDLQDFLLETLTAYGYQVESSQDGLICQSPATTANTPVLLAHLDTINTRYANDLAPSEEDIIEVDGFISLAEDANPDLECLGADDRVGVKTILDILDRGHRPHLIFPRDEESGCIGSRAMANRFSQSPDDYTFLYQSSVLIQIDRGVHEGYWNEMVFYGYDYQNVPAFYQQLETYYTHANGSNTDVAVLGPILDKPIVNLSASYENEHSRDEVINLSWYAHNLHSLDQLLTWLDGQDTSRWSYWTED